MNALQIAIEGLASSTPEAFLKWAEENSQLDALVVQQLVAHGYRIAADQLSSLALDWLLLDPRRFQLGTRYGHRQTTVDLVRACAPRRSEEHTSELQSLMRISYAVFCLKKKNKRQKSKNQNNNT